MYMIHDTSHESLSPLVGWGCMQAEVHKFH